MDIYELLSMLHSDKQVQKQQAERRGMYRDEPIVRTASQMMLAVPKKIREMRSLSGLNAEGIRTQEALFYEQGVFMADYIDDYPWNEDLIRYYPTYQSLNDRQLRGYFTWRKDIRNGIYKKAPTAFAFLHIYELIHLIGVANAKQGFSEMTRFYEKYSPLEPTLKKYLPHWLDDFCVYYQLSEHIKLLSCDEKLAVIADKNAFSDHERTNAMSALSSYAFVLSSFYKEHTELAERVLCMSYDALTICDSDRLSRFFGERIKKSYHPFESAVFYDHLHRRNFAFTASSTRSYQFCNGIWTVEAYELPKGKSPLLTVFLKAVDALLRDAFGYRPKLKMPEINADMKYIICECIETVKTEQRNAKISKVVLDFSKLPDIRISADHTCEKLISDEEREEILIEHQQTEDIEASANVNGTCPMLSDTAHSLLVRLLYGGDTQDIYLRAGVIPSVLADEINEAFYSDIGDNVLDYDGFSMTLIDDYVDDLKMMILEDN